MQLFTVLNSVLIPIRFATSNPKWRCSIYKHPQSAFFVLSSIGIPAVLTRNSVEIQLNPLAQGYPKIASHVGIALRVSSAFSTIVLPLQRERSCPLTETLFTVYLPLFIAWPLMRWCRLWIIVLFSFVTFLEGRIRQKYLTNLGIVVPFVSLHELHSIPSHLTSHNQLGGVLTR